MITTIITVSTSSTTYIAISYGCKTGLLACLMASLCTNWRVSRSMSAARFMMVSSATYLDEMVCCGMLCCCTVDCTDWPAVWLVAPLGWLVGQLGWLVAPLVWLVAPLGWLVGCQVVVCKNTIKLSTLKKHSWFG